MTDFSRQLSDFHRDSLIFGTNLKMHQTPSESVRFARAIARGLGDIQLVNAFIIPPATSLLAVAEICHQAGIKLGAQNMHWAEEGAFTGEISARMILASGASLVMLGHAERRQMFGETDWSIKKKLESALHHGLSVLLCIGETAEERRAGVTFEVISRQLKIALSGGGRKAIGKLIIAYEPLWAIGKRGRAAKARELVPVLTFVRSILSEIFGGFDMTIPLLYGGSVDAFNCREYVNLDQIDGLFVGRSAWTAEGFLHVLTASLDIWRGKHAKVADCNGFASINPISAKE